MSTAFHPTFNVSKLFLDRANIQKRIGQGRARALSRQGAFVRTTAIQKVLRRRKGVSRPGGAPSVRSRDSIRTLRKVLFSYDDQSESVVVGPVKLNQVNQTSAGRLSVPQLLEFGGTAKIHEVQYNPGGVWFRRDLRKRQRSSYAYRIRSAIYAPRPFMSVALQREIDAGTITDSWHNVLQGGS